MLSRVADSIYWMNRYLERVENYARFMDVNFNLMLELPPNVSEQWKPLVLTTGDWALYESLYQTESKSQVIFFLGFDLNNPNSIYSSIRNARENARAVRPELTTEVWEQINHIYYLVKDGHGRKHWKKSDPRKFFTEVKKGCQLVHGIFDSTISRTDGWHFGKMGQLIERADKTSRVLDVKYHMLLPSNDTVGSPFDMIHWAALLKSVGAYDMYRKKYGKLTPYDISEFLILDKVFPRAILRCLIHAENSLYKITGGGYGYSNIAEKRMGILKSQLEYEDINTIFDFGLHEYLDRLQEKLNEVSNGIFDTFFSIENVLKIK